MCCVQLDHVFPNYLIYGTIFGKFIGHKRFLFSVQLLPAIFLTPTRIKWHTVYHKPRRSSSEVPSCLSQFHATRIFSTDFLEILKYKLSWKSVQWELSCSMRTDRQTDMTKLIVAFRNFGKAHKKTPLCKMAHNSNQVPCPIASQIKKGKLNCTLVQALRLCTGRTVNRGSRGMALLFLDHGIRRGWGVSVTPRSLFTPGKYPVPIVQEAGWATGPVWTGAENLASTGIRSLDRPAHSQLLYRLRYPAHTSQILIRIIYRY